MAAWHAVDVFATDPDRLLLEVVRPRALRERPGVQAAYWRRGHVGGPHVRLCVWTDRPEAVERAVRAAAEPFFAASPPPPTDYDPTAARRTAALEGWSPTAAELRFRTGVVARGRYRPPGLALGTADARALAEAFYAESEPAAYAALESPDRLGLALRLFFVRGVVLSGDCVRPSVAYRSHWEHFRAARPADVGEAIERGAEAQRAEARRALGEVLAWWASPAPLDEGPPAFRHLARALRQGHARVAALLADGAGLLPRPADDAPRRLAALRAAGRPAGAAPLLDALYADEGPFLSFWESRGLLAGRACVNLFYLLLPQVGVSALERFALCRLAYRAVEDHYGVDLADVLRRHALAPATPLR